PVTVYGPPAGVLVVVMVPEVPVVSVPFETEYEKFHIRSAWARHSGRMSANANAATSRLRAVVISVSPQKIVRRTSATPPSCLTHRPITHDLLEARHDLRASALPVWLGHAILPPRGSPAMDHRNPHSGWSLGACPSKRAPVMAGIG